MSRTLLVLLLTVLVFGAVACDTNPNSPNPPSIEEIQRGSEIVDFTLPDGRSMPCLYFAEAEDASLGSVGWFILDCNWDELR